MTVRVRFVTCDDPMSWAIRLGEGGFLFSHAEVLMPDGTYLGAHADGGVQARPAGYDAVYKPIEAWAEVPGTNEQVAASHDFLLAQIGKPYDLSSIARIARGVVVPTEDTLKGQFGQPWEDEASWFCSELVVAALVHAKIMPMPQIAITAITPRDLYFIVGSLTSVSLPAPATHPQSAAMKARPV